MSTNTGQAEMCATIKLSAMLRFKNIFLSLVFYVFFLTH